MRNPLEDPHAGESVAAQFGSNIVTRTVVERRGNDIAYNDSRKVPVQTCWITTWQDWCRKHKAQVVKEGA